MRTRDLLIIAFSGSLSGCSFLFLKVAVEELPFLFVAQARLALGAVTLLCVARLVHAGFPNVRTIWRPLLLVTLFGVAVPIPLQALGTTFVPSGTAALIFAAMPLLTTLLAITLTDAPAYDGRALLLSIGLGLLGVTILVGPAAVDTGGGYIVGCTILLLSSLGHSLGAVEVRRRLSGQSPLTLAMMQMAIASVLLFPLSVGNLVVDPPGAMNQDLATGFAALLAMGVLVAGFGYYTYVHLVVTAGPTAATYVTFVTPPVAVTLGALVLGEEFHRRVALSIALIILCLAVLVRAQTRALRAPSMPGSVAA